MTVACGDTIHECLRNKLTMGMEVMEQSYYTEALKMYAEIYDYQIEYDERGFVVFRRRQYE
jgi:hypothetical protein